MEPSLSDRMLEHPQVADFIAFLRLKNVSSGTIEQYRKVLRDLFRHLGCGIESPGQITTTQLRQYVANLQTRGLASKTINDRVTILKRFFGFLLVEGYSQEDPAQRLPTPKVGKRLPKALSLEETQALLAALEQDTSAVGQRDKVLFNLLYGCGLRVAEAVALQVEDVDFAEGFLRVVGKGNKERRVYLKPALLGLLREYVVSRQLTGYLFPGNAAGHLTTRSVHYRLRHYARKAGLKRKISPHILRHSIAVHYLQGGAPVSFVQGLLGHASLATTGVYLQLTDQMAKEITLKTETALERLTQGERELREARMVYDAGIVEWDGYVAEVLEWLVVNCPSAP
jgi:site-specific recombinase XerD